MSKTKTYIELNGTRYDARGRALEAVIKPAKPHDSASSGQAVDGVVRRHSPVVKAAPKVRNQRVNGRAPTTHRKPQRSETLMRHAVKKPTFSGLLHAKATPVAVGAPTSNKFDGSFGVSSNPQRIKRSKVVTKSALVSKFGSDSLLMRLGHVPVARPPKTAAATIQGTESSAQAGLLSRALEAATSHQQPKVKKPRLSHRVARRFHISPKVLNVSTAILAGILFGGFVIYQNLPNLSLRLAAARSGLHASLPTYHPAGFSLKGPIQYATGELTLNFQSNSDERNFQVKQQATKWNSETLLDAYVAKQSRPYQTYEDHGRTVYIDNNGANLVSGEKWIQVKSDGDLSTEQLLSIVKGIN